MTLTNWLKFQVILSVTLTTTNYVKLQFHYSLFSDWSDYRGTPQPTIATNRKWKHYKWAILLISQHDDEDDLKCVYACVCVCVCMCVCVCVLGDTTAHFSTPPISLLSLPQDHSLPINTLTTRFDFIHFYAKHDSILTSCRLEIDDHSDWYPGGTYKSVTYN